MALEEHEASVWPGSRPAWPGDWQVQEPPPGQFSHSQLSWKHHVKGRAFLPGSTITAAVTCVYAFVPHDRVPDFVKGEGAISEFPCSFRITSAHHKPEFGGTSRHDVWAPKEQTKYWCCYGSEDYRSVVAAAAGSTSKGHRKCKNLNGKSIKHGCRANFDVKRLHYWSDVAAILYNECRHVDAAGEICHGPTYNGDPRSRFAAHLSDDIRAYVRQRLQAGVSKRQIYLDHVEQVAIKARDEDYLPHRDDFLQLNDIKNIAAEFTGEFYQLHPSDETSVHMWIAGHPQHVWYVHDRQPFTLGLQTEFQRDMMVRYGHGNVISIDATFGTNKYKFHLYTVLIFDHHYNGVPVAWVLTDSGEAEAISTWLLALKTHMHNHHAAWKPSAFLVDDARAEISAIERVWSSEIPIMLCLWHVRKCWLRHLMLNVKDWNSRMAMFQALGDIMYVSKGFHSESQAKSLLLEFYAKYETEEKNFVMYMKKQWEPQLPRWLKYTRLFPHAGQDCNSGIESWHAFLKSLLYGDFLQLRGRRMDWLIHTLINKVSKIYWHRSFCKEYEFITNYKGEGYIESAVKLASNIPDTNVQLPTGEGLPAFVRSVHDTRLTYTVYNPTGEWACCTCPRAAEGFYCKHQAKVMLMLGLFTRTTDLLASRPPCRDPMQPPMVADNENCAPEPEQATNDAAGASRSRLSISLMQLQKTWENILGMVEATPKLLEHACPLLHMTELQLAQVQTQWDVSIDQGKLQLHKLDNGLGNSIKRKKSFVETQHSWKTRSKKPKQKMKDALRAPPLVEAVPTVS